MKNESVFQKVIMNEYFYFTFYRFLDIDIEKYILLDNKNCYLKNKRTLTMNKILNKECINAKLIAAGKPLIKSINEYFQDQLL